MYEIKKWVQKVKRDVKFKMAGPGQTVGSTTSKDDPGQTSSANMIREAGAGSKNSELESSKDELQRSVPRKDLSDEQKAAASAAMKRLEQSSFSTDNLIKKRSQDAIRAMALKELEQEHHITNETAKLKERYGKKPIVELEGPSMLGNKGVLYKCPTIFESSIVLPYDEIEARIRNYLYEKMNSEDKGLTACLIIHTLNKDTDKVKTCINTICKYIDNIIQHPNEEKYRKIKKSNQAFLGRVSSVEGHDLFLSACGFKTDHVDNEQVWIYPSSAIEKDPTFALLQNLKNTLLSTDPIKVKLDRNLRVLQPNQSSKQLDLSPDFFNYSSKEIRKEHEMKIEIANQQAMLRTKEMRERETQRDRKRYRYTLIRIRFPDGLLLQGTFAVHETFAAVVKFVNEALESPDPFVLIEAGAGQIDNVKSGEKTLNDLGLVPSAVLNFKWEQSLKKDTQHKQSNETSKNGKTTYLKQELVDGSLQG